MLLQNLEQPICRDNGIPCGKLHDALYNSLTPPNSRPKVSTNLLTPLKGSKNSLQVYFNGSRVQFPREPVTVIEVKSANVTGKFWEDADKIYS